MTLAELFGQRQCCILGGPVVSSLTQRLAMAVMLASALLAGCASRSLSNGAPTIQPTVVAPTIAIASQPYGPKAPPTAQATATVAASPTIQPTVAPTYVQPSLTATIASIGSPTAAQPQATIIRPKPPAAGQTALDFSLKDLQGNTVSLSDYRGKKVMLNFWATWCGPCRAEIPHMVKLYDEIRDQGFEILAVNLRDDVSKITPFVEQFDMRFPVLLDTTGLVGAAYYVRGIPTSVFLDEEGVIQAVHTGTLSDAMLRAYVDKLMEGE